MTAMAFLEDLATAAREAKTAEAGFRREVAARIAGLERERAFAFRRLNLMKVIVEAVGRAEDVPTGVAYGTAALRARLGWDSDSESRAAVLASFAPVAEAVFAGLTPSEQGKETNETKLHAALTQFETWYAQTHATPFWSLFEHYIPETPLVDF
jgi:hypothetical protein